MSANFTDALGQLRARLEQTPNPTTIAFFWPATETLTHKFLRPPGNRALAEYILPKGTSSQDYAKLNAAITDKSYSGTEPHPTPHPGTISITLGKRLRVLGVVGPER